MEATRYHQQALDICRREELKELVAVQATHGRAEAYYIAGQLNTAIELFNESLTLARQIGDRSYEAENLQMIAMLHGDRLGTGNYDVCLELAEEALKIGEERVWSLADALFTTTRENLGRSVEAWLAWWFEVRAKMPRQLRPPGTRARGELTIRPGDGAPKLKADLGEGEDWVVGRSDDMVTVRGLNVFPTMVAAVVGGFAELSGDYRIVLDGKPPYDVLPLQVELAEGRQAVQGQAAALAGALERAIKAALGVTARVSVLPPASFPVTEGKTQRVVRNEA